VDTSERVTQILNSFPDAVLEKARFGRSEQALYWLKANRLEDAARALKREGGFELENLSAMEIDTSIVLTYFIRNPETRAIAVLRVSEKLKSPDDWVTHESVATVWPMAVPFEAEISRLFGVKFDGQNSRKEWEGFPLRKSFVLTGGISP
jgi:NADH:ubiquinone oxidoreductase subunit C